MPFITTIESFSFAHALRSNKIPKGVELDKICPILQDNSKMDIKSLGFFDSSAPNFNTYFPDVTPEDLVPQDADFVYPLYRALSMTRINKWGPTNFSFNDAIEKATKKLLGQTVYTNHEMLVGNELGVISEAFFENSYKTKTGIVIPAGSNVRLKIDGKSNPKIARGMMMDPPSVHSVSVTVEFKWEQSHPSLSREVFFEKLGTFDEKGVLIERNVISIENYHEISTVTHGADPYAQKINESGEVTNPEYAKRNSKFSFKEADFKKNTHYFDWRSLEEYSLTFAFKETRTENTIPSLLKDVENPEPSETKNIKPMNDELLKFLKTFFGLAPEVSETDVTNRLQKDLPILLKASSDLKALQVKYPEGSAIITAEDQAKLTAYGDLKTFHDTQLKTIKDEATKLYSLSAGEGKADASVLKLIADSNMETASVLLKQYQAIVEKSFEASCQSCGSKNISRASSFKASGIQNSTGGAGGDTTNLSNAEVTDNFLQQISKSKTSGIHGEVKP